MTTPIKVLVMLGLWGLYALIAWFGGLYTCCGAASSESTLTNTKDNAALAPVVAETESKRYSIDFEWSNPDPYTNEGFESTQKNIVNQLGTDNILDITGYYYDGEDAPEGYDNMGFARANKIKDLLDLDLPEDRVRFHARLLDDKAGKTEGYFEGFEYKWVDAEKTVASTVEELNDRIIIRFPFGSIKKEYSPDVDDYLTKLAARVKETNEKISLTGHTDFVGNDTDNIQLGQARSDQIKQILIDYGVPAELIATASKGESQPVASNKTDEGRHENRRVEVRYIKN